MTILNLKDFMKKFNLKNGNLNGSQVQRVCTYKIKPRNSKIYSDKAFVNIDNGNMGGPHWICFIEKVNKSCYFDSFGGQLDKFQLKNLPKPIIYHEHKIQQINSQLCGSYCLFFFYLIERMNYYDTFLKLVFE